MKSKKKLVNRKFKLPLAELIDKLTVDQIKFFLKKNKNKDTKFLKEIENICFDIDLILQDKKINFDSRFIRKIIILSQINLHIWNLKDNMIADEKNYNKKLKLAHQLNGVRNQIKNLILEYSSELNNSTKKSNFETDNLVGWNIDYLKNTK